MWYAVYAGPGGMGGSYAAEDWPRAADWLRAMMEVAAPEIGKARAVDALRSASPGAEFNATAGRHVFSIGESRSRQLSLI